MKGAGRLVPGRLQFPGLVDDDDPGGNDREKCQPSDEARKRRGVAPPVTASRVWDEPKGCAVGCVVTHGFDFLEFRILRHSALHSSAVGLRPSFFVSSSQIEPGRGLIMSILIFISAGLGLWFDYKSGGVAASFSLGA